MKRIFSLLLALSICLALFPAPAIASEEELPAEAVTITDDCPDLGGPEEEVPVEPEAEETPAPIGQGEDAPSGMEAEEDPIPVEPEEAAPSEPETEEAPAEPASEAENSPFSVQEANGPEENQAVTQPQAVTDFWSLLSPTAAQLQGSFTVPYQANGGLQCGIELYLNGKKLRESLWSCETELADACQGALMQVVPGVTYQFRAVVRSTKTGKNIAEGAMTECAVPASSGGVPSVDLWEKQTLAFDSELYRNTLRFSAPYAGTYVFETSGKQGVELYGADGLKKARIVKGKASTMSLKKGDTLYLDISAASGQTLQVTARSIKAPSLSPFVLTEDGVTVSWGDLGAPAYQLQETAGVRWFTVYNGGEHSLTLTDLSPAHKYTFRVRALNPSGAALSGWSSLQDVVFSAAPKAPTAKNTGKGVQLTWPKAKGATRYRIFRNGEILAHTSALGYTDPSAVPGGVYTYSLLCVDKKGQPTSTAGPETTVTYLSRPAVTVQGTGEGVAVAWEPVPYAVSYRLYRKAGKAWPASPLTETGELCFTDENCSRKGTYSYRLAAVAADGSESRFSAQRSCSFLSVIACVGDSITYGSGVSNPQKQSYPALLQAELGSSFQVNNYGARGSTLLSTGDQPYIKNSLYDRSFTDKPSLYIVMLGTNDSEPYNWDADAYERELEEFLAKYVAAVGTENVIVMKPPRAFSPAEGEPIMYNISEENILSELPIIDRVALRLGLRVIDLHTLTEDHPEWFADGVHPNREGYRQIARTVAEVLHERGL